MDTYVYNVPDGKGGTYSGPISGAPKVANIQSYVRTSAAPAPSLPVQQQLPQGTQAGPQSSFQYPTQSLQPGQSGPAVTQLQQWLISQGFAIPDGATGFYGEQTKAAVNALQQRLGVDNSTGPGYWGPRTVSALGTAQTGLQSQQQQAPAPKTIPGTDIETTGNPTLDSILTGLGGYVQNNLAQGNVVNPALQITPDLVSKFLQQAHTQVDPYYRDQMNQELDNINASLKNLGAQYGFAQGDAQAQFQQGLATSREAAAGAGTAFSGGRGLNEQNMLSAQNRTLGALDTAYQQKIGDTLRAGAAKIGTNTMGLPSTANFQLPSLVGQRATLEGARGGTVGGNSLDLGYNPSNYSLGSLVAGPQGYSSALTNSANQFLSSYLGSAANNSARLFQNVNGVPTLT